MAPRKTFAAAPRPRQPTDHEISVFERSGAGHDTAARGEEPTRRLSIDLPATVHQRFKTACAANGRKMTAEVEELITRRTAELEAQAGLVGSRRAV